jgi:primosomal protein N' (replication factor Y)
MTSEYPLQKSLIRVAVPGPFETGLDYLPPEEGSPLPSLGSRVLVPLGKKKVVGVVVEITRSETLEAQKNPPVLDSAEQTPFKYKAIDAVLDPSPIYSRALFELILWMSRYYHHPIGETFQTALIGPLSKAEPLSKPTQRKSKKEVSTSSVKQDFPKTLSLEQKTVLEESFLKTTFHVQCLEGVTGSGKTEIYLQRIAPLMTEGKQVLILVPEIGLTPQTIERFQSRFNVPIAVLHSGLNDTERRQAILASAQGEAKIIIGTRSAVFVPTHDLAFILIDEEHDLSFKQQNGLRYHARDLAIKRAQLENIPVLLGSATPSLETLHHALSGKYVHLKLSERAQGNPLPPIYCINLKAQKNITDGLSQPLIEAIKRHLNQGNQALIFINRRGFSPVLMCHECGWQAACPRCDKAYTLHIHPTRLHCHHCDVQKPAPKNCPSCENEAPLSDVGVGTEKIEIALQQLFPNKKVLRIDRSNTTQKKAMEKHLEQIQSGEADILVGTQMLAKGHHFKQLTLVGMVKVDDALFSNDFRSSEHLGQLITQVAGRAGRENAGGEVYLQTAHPEHPLLKLLLESGYSTYAKALLEERKHMDFPPFSHLALIRAESHSLEKNHTELLSIKTLLQPFSEGKTELHCLGPFPAFLAKRGGVYRSGLLIQSKDRRTLHHALNELQRFLKHHPIKKIRLFFDVDPIELE